jgi:putative sterol carrier protein|tara:strand:- start:8050 stop:8448 length:399 start_codon:yes stop_codon:yes gene_type:complete
MMNMREKKKMLIEKLFKVGVKRINKDMDIPQFKKKFCPNEDRTLELNIIGMDHLDTGFVIEENAIRTYKRLKDTPTCRIWMDEDVFISIKRGDITFTQAFFYGFLTIKGENYIRDLQIFQRIIDENKDTFIG